MKLITSIRTLFPHKISFSATRDLGLLKTVFNPLQMLRLTYTQVWDSWHSRGGTLLCGGLCQGAAGRLSSHCDLGWSTGRSLRAKEFAWLGVRSRAKGWSIGPEDGLALVWSRRKEEGVDPMLKPKSLPVPRLGFLIHEHLSRGPGDILRRLRNQSHQHSC
jgi:hypothetical protein